MIDVQDGHGGIGAVSMKLEISGLTGRRRLLESLRKSRSNTIIPMSTAPSVFLNP
jgi:hypothetical protein